MAAIGLPTAPIAATGRSCRSGIAGPGRGSRGTFPTAGCPLLPRHRFATGCAADPRSERRPGVARAGAVA